MKNLRELFLLAQCLKYHSFFSKTHFAFSIIIILISTASVSLGQTILVPEDAVWNYLDNGSDQGTAWKETGFDDSSWSMGDAELGYGDGDESTVLSFGPDADNKYTTYYFRHEFTVADPDATPNLKLRLLRDDGAVVYINGTEVARDNMPTGTITYLTFAASTVSGADEDTFFEFIIPADQLVSGTNVVAVEIHQRNLSSSDISFNLKLSTTTQALEIFRKEPYLIYSGINTEMVVLWQLVDNYSSTCQWGLNTSYGLGNQATTEYGTDHQHTITLTGLSNYTRYYYRVIANFDTVVGHFLTGPTDNVSNVTLLAYGDTRTYPNDHDNVAGQIIANYTADTSAQTLLLLSGDLVADGDVESDWDNQFFDRQYQNIQEMLGGVSMMACLGNHEGAGALFEKYFPYPFYSASSYYWSFDYGPVHISIIDQYTSYAVGSTQYQWLESDLSGTDKVWKIIILHEPGWSAGGHGNNTDVQNIIQPLCEQYGVQFVIAGHNHYYSRAENTRVEHITTGGGGAPLYDASPTYPYIVETRKVHHFCKLEIDGDTLHFAAIEHDGDIIEEFDYYSYFTWTGAVDTDWENTGNWEMGVVPSSYSDVVIPTTAIRYPVVGTAVSINKLTVQDGATVNVGTTGVLSVADE